jgi:hypothetical protein
LRLGGGREERAECGRGEKSLDGAARERHAPRVAVARYRRTC